ncbi:hypothetical protein BGZ76_003985, partial [Entomortierella beljakovae]
MENMFNTDSGLRPPSPLSFPSAPGHGLFGEPQGYEGSSTAPSTSLPHPPLPPGIPPNSMMNMMMPPGFGPADPSMQLFNPSEQRFFSEFLDTLVVDQDFTFDPSAIPNLPNLALFSTDPMTIPNMDNGVDNNTHNYMIPSTSTSSTSISTGLSSSTTVGSVSPQRHSVGTSMDFDITGVYNNNNNSSGSARPSESQHPITVPAKRTKTSKTTSSTSTDPAGSSPVRKGTPSHGETGNRITTPMSKLSLNNNQVNQNGINSNNNSNGSSTTPSKSKKNKREQEDEDEKREDITQSPPGNAHRNPHHRISGSSVASGSSRPQSQQTIKHERNNSLSDEYASDNAASNGVNGNANGHEHHSNANGSPTTTAASSAAGVTPKRKPYKELLTEEEKRANHIASEQKRRNTIRNGFKDMTEIIPDLKDVNSSKSTILFKAVDFIRYLEKRNKNLQEKANQLEQRLHIQKGSQQHQQQQHQLMQQQQQQSY